MRSTQLLRASGGDGPIGKYGKYLGGWGGLRAPQQAQKGIIVYSRSFNNQNPFAGAFHDAIFNTWRRFRGQVLYVAPPFIGAYFLMSWAIDRNHYLNSKPGRLESGGHE